MNDQWSKTSVKRIAVMIFGPLARVWERDGYVTIGLEGRDGQKVPIASGPSYREAIEDMCQPLRGREALERSLAARRAGEVGVEANPTPEENGQTEGTEPDQTNQLENIEHKEPAR